MKTPLSLLISFVVITVIAYTVTFTGCSNSVTSTGTAPQTYPALTERDFIDTNFYAVPGSVVMLYLESLHSPVDPTHPDTDSIGTDVVRIRLAGTIVHTVKLGDSCRFTVTIKDKMTGNIVSALDPVNNMQTVTLPAGDYIIKIRSLVEFTGGSDTHQNIFFQPDRNAAFSRGGGNQEVYADSNSVHTLLTTNSCVSCDLSYADLSYANLSYANLNHANLNHANLNHANLNHANLSYTNLSYANLYGLYLQYSDFSNANLSYADLRFTTLAYTKFNYANLSNAHCDSTRTIENDFSFANLYRADFNHSDLRSSTWNQTKLKRVNFKYANLDNITLSYLTLDSADLSYAMYTDNIFCNYASFRNANLSHTDFNHSHFSHSFLDNADLNHANFSYADLSYISSQNSIWAHLNASHADLNHANLMYSDWSYANLTYANLSYAFLERAILNNANFCHANKTGMDGEPVTYNGYTQCWP